MRSIQDQSHETSGKGTSDGNGHNPRNQQETDTLPVDSLESAVAESNTDSSTGDTHGRRNGQGKLGEDQNSDGSAHFHGRATGRRVVGDFVTHD